MHLRPVSFLSVPTFSLSLSTVPEYLSPPLRTHDCTSPNQAPAFVYPNTVTVSSATSPCLPWPGCQARFSLNLPEHCKEGLTSLFCRQKMCAQSGRDLAQGHTGSRVEYQEDRGFLTPELTLSAVLHWYRDWLPQPRFSPTCRVTGVCNVCIWEASMCWGGRGSVCPPPI